MTAPATIDPSTLTKVSVNCIPQTIAALEEVAAATGGSKTDEINRAIQIYALLVATPSGAGFTYEAGGGVRRQVWVTDTEPRRRSFTFRFFWRGRRRPKPDVS